ncbi:hypothetical protein BJX76DRAFT_244966 [Aspergillus varians]
MRCRPTGLPTIALYTRQQHSGGDFYYSRTRGLSKMANVAVRITRAVWRIVWLFLLRPLGLFIVTGGIISLFRYALGAW